MIIMKKTYDLRYWSGACFSILAVWQGYFFFRKVIVGHIDVWSLFLFVGLSLLAVSLFVSRPILTTVGSIFCVITHTYDLFCYVLFYVGSFRENYIVIVACAAFEAISFIFLLIASLSRSAAKPLGIAASIAYAISCLFCCVGLYAGYVRISCTAIIRLYVLPIIAITLFAFPSTVEGNRKVVKKATPTSSESQVSRLIKLKSLLDNGTITQEEFDAKEKQILGPEVVKIQR